VAAIARFNEIGSEGADRWVTVTEHEIDGEEVK
jgi:hypothetical protein